MPIDPNRWTLKTQEAFNAAVDQARSRNNPEVTTDHLLSAMLGQEGTVTLPVRVSPTADCNDDTVGLAARAVSIVAAFNSLRLSVSRLADCDARSRASGRPPWPDPGGGTGGSVGTGGA